MNNITVLSKTQHIIVEPAGSSISVENAGPIGPAGPPASNDFTVGAVPSAPASGVVKIFAKSFGGREMLAQRASIGDSFPMQPFLGQLMFSRWQPKYGQGSLDVDGAAFALAIVGSNVSAAMSSTNLYAYMRHLELLQTVAATTNVVGFRSAIAAHMRGNAAKIGGFYFACRWGPATGVATATTRAFCGMCADTAAPTDVETSTLLNMIGMGWDAADTNIQMFHNDASGAATKIDLGASFPVPVVDRAHVYEIQMYCPPNGSYISYEITDLVTDVVATGTISTNLPVNTTLITTKLQMSVGGTSSVIGVAMFLMYTESEY